MLKQQLRRLHISKDISKGQLDLPNLKDLVIQSLDDDKALDIEVIDIAEKSSLKQTALADYIVVASGTSSTQIIRMAEKLKDRLNAKGIKNVRIEGKAQGDWVVLDAHDIVVHLFRPEVREFYGIERMWNMGAEAQEKSGSESIQTA